MSDAPPPATPPRAHPRVALFVPCLTEHFDGRVAEASARLLMHLGVALDYPRAQTCCGQPFRTAGDLASAASLARRMDSVFASADHVVTPSASCAAMVRTHIPDLAGPLDISRKTFELAEYLVHVLAFDPATVVWPGSATYHPSCHGRDLHPLAAPASPDTPRAPDPTLAILSRIQGLTLMPLPHAAQCCGFGGSFATRFAPVSVALGRDKLAQAERTTATTLIANDGGCRLHLGGLPTPLEVKHLAEILAEGLGLMPRRPRMKVAAP